MAEGGGLLRILLLSHSFSFVSFFFFKVPILLGESVLIYIFTWNYLLEV